MIVINIGIEKSTKPKQPTVSSGLFNEGNTSRRVAVVLNENRRKKAIGKKAPGMEAIKTDFPKFGNGIQCAFQ